MRGCREATSPFLRHDAKLSNLQKITCIILRNLFGLYLFSHQSCATGTLLLRKKIYPRKSSLNLRQLIFFMLLKTKTEARFSPGFGLSYSILMK